MINEKIYYKKGYYVLALYKIYYEKLNDLPMSEENALGLKEMWNFKGYTVVLIHEDDFEKFILLNNLTNKKRL